jgi:hypothetical protein
MKQGESVPVVSVTCRKLRLGILSSVIVARSTKGIVFCLVYKPQTSDMLSCFRPVLIRTRTLVKVTSTSLTHSVPLTPTSSRAFSVLNRSSPSYDGHVPLLESRGALSLLARLLGLL